MAVKPTKLNAKHKAAVRLKIEGRSNAFICDQIGVADKTLRVWFSTDIVKKYMEDLADAVEVNFTEKLGTVGAEAIDQLLELIKKPDRDSDISAHTKMDAIAMVLDRIPQTATNQDRRQIAGGGGDTNNALVFANMTNESLAEFIHGGWRQGLPSGNGDGN